MRALLLPALVALLLPVGGARPLLAQDVPGDVIHVQKVSGLEGGFGGQLGPDDAFGSSLVSPGDLDGDTVPDLIAGAPGDTVAGVAGAGTVWLLHPRVDGTIKAWRAINTQQGGFTGPLSVEDFFGSAVAVLGDVDGDGVDDLAVGARGTDVGGKLNKGALYVLLLEAGFTVKAQTRITQGEGGFGGLMTTQAEFGTSLAGLGDLDGDGVPDLAVGAPNENGGGTEPAASGVVWVLLLEADGSVKTTRRIKPDGLGSLDRFGQGLAPLGDLDGDGRTDLAVGVIGDSTGVFEGGAVWLLALEPDGTAEVWGKITADDPAFGGAIQERDHLGSSLAAVGDLDHDGVVDLAAGALDTGPGFTGEGAVWILHLTAQGGLRAATRLGDCSGGLGDVLDDGDRFGMAVAALGDLDQDGSPDLAVGTGDDSDFGPAAGAVWMLSLTDHGWLPLPGGLAGVAGVPVLTGAGDLAGGTPFTLAVGAAAGNAAVFWLLGLTELAAPFKGGVLVPAPDVVLAGPPTDAAGTTSVGGTWPGSIPSGFPLWWQPWIVDPSGPKGLAATNGLQSVTP